jgi:hypothetical protein
LPVGKLGIILQRVKASEIAPIRREGDNAHMLGFFQYSVVHREIGKLLESLIEAFIAFERREIRGIDRTKFTQKYAFFEKEYSGIPEVSFCHVSLGSCKIGFFLEFEYARICSRLLRKYVSVPRVRT